MSFLCSRVSVYSHTRIQRYKPYTATVFIASALRKLADLGAVLYGVGPGDRPLGIQRDHLLLGSAPMPGGRGRLDAWEQYAQEFDLDLRLGPRMIPEPVVANYRR